MLRLEGSTARFGRAEGSLHLTRAPCVAQVALHANDRHRSSAAAGGAALLLRVGRRTGQVCEAMSQPQPSGARPPATGEQQQQPQPLALTRRPLYAPAQPTFLSASVVTDKQVISRNSGNSLGMAGEAWVEPTRLEVVSFELEAKKTVGTTVSGNVALSAIQKIGDVVLVPDEDVLFQQPLDGRFGFIKLVGMEVRTRSGKVLGKVRDFYFNPDNGRINKIEFDDFGLRFLPVNFFDTFSVSVDLVESATFGAVIVSTDNYVRQEKQGIFSSVLKGLSSRAAPAPAGYLTDGYRGEAGYLPQGYTYEQWQNDIRRWEQETGYTYEEYMQRVAGGSAAGMQRPALGTGRTSSLTTASTTAPQRQTQQRYSLPAPGTTAAGSWGARGQPGVAMPPQQAYPQQPNQQSYPGMDPRFRGTPQTPGPRYPAGPSPMGDPRQLDPRQAQAPQQQRQVEPAGPYTQRQGPTPGQQGPGGSQPASWPATGPGSTGNGAAPQSSASGSGGMRMRVDDWIDRASQQQKQDLALDALGPGPGQGVREEASGWDVARRG